MRLRQLSWVIAVAGVAGLLGAAVWFASWRPALQESKSDFALRSRMPPVAVRNVAFEDGVGRSRSLAEFRGKYVLLNLWATWCAPCREELPSLSRLARALGGPQFEVLALSVDTVGPEVVKRFYAETGVDGLAIYVDRSLQANAALSVIGLPTTVLIDRDGLEVARLIGAAEWDSPKAIERIRQMTGLTTTDIRSRQ